MSGRTDVRVVCGECGEDSTVHPPDILIVDDQHYRYVCPACDLPTVRPMNGRVETVLRAVGVDSIDDIISRTSIPDSPAHL